MTRTQLIALMSATLHARREGIAGIGKPPVIDKDVTLAIAILNAVEARDDV